MALRLWCQTPNQKWRAGSAHGLKRKQTSMGPAIAAYGTGHIKVCFKSESDCRRLSFLGRKTGTMAGRCPKVVKPAAGVKPYFFLWRFLRRRFLRLCVAILWPFLFFPLGIFVNI